MSNKNDGGPAFPVPVELGETLTTEKREIVSIGGMSLRAWLTGQALCGWAAGRNGDGFCESSAHEIVADACVKYADAVIKRLEEP